MTGKPNKNTPKDLRSLARGYTDVAIRALGTIAENGTNEGARVAASTALLDRGWNKPASQVEHTGKDGAEEIRVTLRTIVEGRAK